MPLPPFPLLLDSPPTVDSSSVPSSSSSSTSDTVAAAAAALSFFSSKENDIPRCCCVRAVRACGASVALGLTPTIFFRVSCGCAPASLYIGGRFVTQYLAVAEPSAEPSARPGDSHSHRPTERQTECQPCPAPHRAPFRRRPAWPAAGAAAAVVEAAILPDLLCYGPSHPVDCRRRPAQPDQRRHCRTGLVYLRPSSTGDPGFCCRWSG
jgi:hypothetical protein